MIQNNLERQFLLDCTQMDNCYKVLTNGYVYVLEEHGLCQYFLEIQYLGHCLSHSRYLLNVCRVKE